MDSKPKWLSEIERSVDATPYGSVKAEVVRVNRHTTKVILQGTETLRYTNNTEAITDIVTLLEEMVDGDYTGAVQFKVAIQNGQITLLAIENNREINYQNEKRHDGKV